MGLLILGALLVMVVAFFISGGLLMWITKIFKIKNPSYKKSLIIVFVLGVASIVAGFIFGLIKLGFLSNLLVSIATFFVFYYFYKKYYKISWKKTLGIYIVFGIIGAILSLFIVIPIRLYVALPFSVAGEAMSPAYNSGDYLLINKFDKSFVRGDVVVFSVENQPQTFFIKRIIGLPSEKIDIKDGKVLVNGQVLNESYNGGQTAPDSSVTLGQDQYFVLGDNRSVSKDSRNFGPINKSSIEGKILYKVSGAMAK